MVDLGTNMIAHRNAAIEMAVQLCRQKVRLIAPVVDQMPQLYPNLVVQMDKYFAIRHCPVCTPPPKVYKCPICDYETEERWRMQNHNMGGQNWYCKKRQKAKERAWASKVGLDG